LENQLKAAH